MSSIGIARRILPILIFDIKLSRMRIMYFFRLNLRIVCEFYRDQLVNFAWFGVYLQRGFSLSGKWTKNKGDVCYLAYLDVWGSHSYLKEYLEVRPHNWIWSDLKSDIGENSKCYASGRSFLRRVNLWNLEYNDKRLRHSNDIFQHTCDESLKAVR